jgi:hypothetical protein
MISISQCCVPLDDTSFNWDNILLCKLWYINVIEIVQQVMAVGLNTVREICMRIPLIMTKELLTDLALYKKSREKAVSAAARSIIAVYRQVLLPLNAHNR